MHPDVWHVVTGAPRVLRLMGSGVRRPRIPVPGTDLAGTVESVGADVTRFRVGDQVFGESIRGVQWVNGGAYAELAVAPESGLAAKPPGISFAAASTVPTAGLIVLHNLAGVGPIRPGQEVLVNGAAGGVGGIAVQLAVAYGARVTGVDSGEKRDVVLALGAHRFSTTGPRTSPGAASSTTWSSTSRATLVPRVPTGDRARRPLRADRPRPLRHGRPRWLGSIPRFVGLMAASPFVKQAAPPNFKAPDKAEAMAVLAELLAAGKPPPSSTARSR